MSSGNIGLILASHATLADVLVSTVNAIVDSETDLKSFPFADNEDPQTGSRRLQELVRKCDRGRGVIILVDLFGGTPGSLAMSLLELDRVEVVTGMNLSMAIAAATLDPKLELEEAAKSIVAAGIQSIQQASAMLNS